MNTIRIFLEDRERAVKLSYSIAPEVPRMVSGDALRLRQILLNLLSNGIKFTEKGYIALSVKRLQDDVDNRITIQFQVRDTGKGIPADKHKTIFEQFSQEDDSSTRQFAGTGLGLAICRQLCDLMGGDIAVKSIPGQGSTFIFHVVFQPCEGKQRPALRKKEERREPEASPLTLLLVEDNEPNRTLARMVLEKASHTVVEAYNGLQALHRLGQQDFDVVLMDVQMPEMDGLTATRIIRAAERGEELDGIAPPLAAALRARLGGHQLPIIAMTANAMTSDREKCLASGMNDYLSKPFDPSRLATLLRKITHTMQNPMQDTRE